MAQRLADSSSLYLRQHQHQEVDWWPYSAAPFEQARRLGRPVLLSIGYAACHWCHVMSHESFDDPQIAAFINEHFIAIKVDREQHPLVDDTYMLATQAMTGAGGWPMTVFTLPDGRAFHTGTYYPATPQGRIPAFSQVLQAVHEAYTERREAVEQQAAALAAHLGQLSSGHHQMASLNTESAEAGSALADAVRTWIASTEPSGGFSPAPKFPPTQSLIVIWQQLLTSASPEELFDAACQSTEALLLGGLHDHVNGGFARYCVDEQWAVPHFEKMLYDNAQLLRMLAICHRVCTLLGPQLATDSRRTRAENLTLAAQRAVQGIVRWLKQDMLTVPAGTPGTAFAASRDADSERAGGHAEGAYYTFSATEREELLGQLTQPLPPAMVRWVEVADDPGYFCLSLARMPQPQQWALWDELLDKARRRLVKRTQPQRDEKVIAGWNGLAIEALSRAATIMGEPSYRELAEAVAENIWSTHLAPDSGELARTSFAAVADRGNPGTLEDYAALCLGFFVLAEAKESNHWTSRAQQLLKRALNFVDPQGLARDSMELDPMLSAQRDQQPAANLLDDAIPAASSLLARALATDAIQKMASGEQTTDLRTELDQAASLVAHSRLLAAKFPTAAAGALEVNAMLDRQIQYLAMAGSPDAQTDRWQALSATLGLGIGVATASQEPNPDGSLRVYPCRYGSCQAPVTEPEQLLENLRR